MTTFRVAIAGGWLWAAAAVCLGQTPVPLGEEFRVDTDTGYTGLPQVAMDGAGNFVVVWQSGDIFGRRFDASGIPLSAPFRVNTYTTGLQWRSALAMNGSGEFVVVWQSDHQDGNLGGIFGQRFDATGAPEGPEFLVPIATVRDQRNPAVGVAGDGSFVVAWSGYVEGGTYYGVYGRRFDAFGNAQGGDVPLRPRWQRPAIAMQATGDFVVAWRLGGIQARRFDATMSPQGPNLVVDSRNSSVDGPSVALDTEGGFKIAWMGPAGIQGDFSRDVFARSFDVSGNAGPTFRVNTVTTSEQILPSVAMGANGSFVVVWRNDNGSSGFVKGIHGRAFDASGRPTGPEFQVSALTAGGQNYPVIVGNAGGDFVVAWSSVPSMGIGQRGIFVRRWATPADLIFADGFESGGLTAWSATQTDGGDLVVSAGAAMASTAFGVEATVDDRAGLYVQDDAPMGESRYRARFYLDPSGYDPGEANGNLRTRVFLVFEEAPVKRIAQVVLRRLAGEYAIAASVRRDDDTLADTAFSAISAGPHAIEIDWRRASGPGASDGTFELWIDGTSVATLSGLDNDGRAAHFARLGALSVKAGASGTLRFDQFESRRYTYIGMP